MAGHIKLDRKILQWEWYQDVNTCRLFIHLLLIANHKDGRWHGQNIKRGQLITGLEKLSAATGLSVMQLRTCFSKLKLTNEITIKVTNKFRIITICKYDFYQSFRNENNKQNDNQITNDLTNEQQTSNKQVTANNNDNNNNNNNKEDNNRGTGDFASPEPPHPVQAVFLAADGSLVKEAAYSYKAEHFNGLPDKYARAIINSIKSVKNIDVDNERIKVAWESFKLLEIQKKVYRTKEDVYSFFSNYCKKQTWKTDKPVKSKENPKEKVFGIEFINDFKQCKMSDGSVQELEINQSDLARYNQISPKDISKK